MAPGWRKKGSVTLQDKMTVLNSFCVFRILAGSVDMRGTCHSFVLMSLVPLFQMLMSAPDIVPNVFMTLCLGLAVGSCLCLQNTPNLFLTLYWLCYSLSVSFSPASESWLLLEVWMPSPHHVLSMGTNVSYYCTDKEHIAGIWMVILEFCLMGTLKSMETI